MTVTQLPQDLFSHSSNTLLAFIIQTHTEHETHLEEFGGGPGAAWLSHVKADHGGVLSSVRVPLRYWLETALCGNAHLVETPGGRRQETGRGWGGGKHRMLSHWLLFFLSLYSTYVCLVLVSLHKTWLNRVTVLISDLFYCFTFRSSSKSTMWTTGSFACN